MSAEEKEEIMGKLGDLQTQIDAIKEGGVTIRKSRLEAEGIDPQKDGEMV